ncbi:hypothetical protein TNCV_4749821 [Trichonephila clavipes]|nr:hypothetical protein TNCV_4749821 [Trichonephila clavipes]
MLLWTDEHWCIRREVPENKHPVTIAGVVQAEGGSIMGHLDRVVHIMDPHSRDLAQLVMALELTWINIPVNVFRKLIYSLPSRFATVRFAKDGYSGF